MTVADIPLPQLRGTAGSVPWLATPPITARPDAPIVLIWHLMDSPRTETAMAAALPLDGVDAWRVYLGLPLLGTRLPKAASRASSSWRWPTRYAMSTSRRSSAPRRSCRPH
jgi:hypothetical protein